jgi:hypothetical protein
MVTHKGAGWGGAGLHREKDETLSRPFSLQRCIDLEVVSKLSIPQKSQTRLIRDSLLLHVVLKIQVTDGISHWARRSAGLSYFGT